MNEFFHTFICHLWYSLCTCQRIFDIWGVINIAILHDLFIHIDRYFLERSHSARMTLSKAYELCPEEVSVIFSCLLISMHFNFTIDVVNNWMVLASVFPQFNLDNIQEIDIFYEMKELWSLSAKSDCHKKGCVLSLCHLSLFKEYDLFLSYYYVFVV